MKPIIFLLAIAFASALTATAQDVSYNFDKDADFTKYKTYRWEQHPKSQGADQLTLSQLGAAFDAELATKGLQKSTTNDSDLVIVYQIGTSQQQELTSFSSGYGYGGGWGRYGYGGGYGGSGITTTTASTITTGAAALDMYDAAKKQLVWRGTATKTIDVNAKPEKRQKNMAKAAKKMLKNYPPKVKS